MRYLNTKNLIAAGVLLACMSSIAWGAIIPDRTRIIMNESDKGEALKLTNQSKNLPYLAQTWIEDTKGNKSRDFIVTVPPMVRLNPSEQIQIRMIKLLNCLMTEKRSSILTCEKYRQKQIKKM